jgi:hypothetical protein
MREHALAFPAQSCGIAVGLIALFLKGVEDALPEDGRLTQLGIGDASALFMLQRPGRLL